MAKHYSDDELIADLGRVAKLIGRSPTRKEYKKAGRFSSCVIEERFGSWTKAKRSAGLVAYQSHVRLDLCPPPATSRYDKAPKITGDAMILPDPHCPTHSVPLLEKYMAIAKRFKIRQQIIPGDFLMADRFSQFPLKSKTTFEEEKEIAQALFKWMFGFFDTTYWIMGNHDARFLMKLDGEVKLSALGAIICEKIGTKKLICSDYAYCILTSGGIEWRLNHPFNYSRIGGRNPCRLAEKYRQNVASGHNHLLGFSYDISGTNIGADLGTACDPSRVHYQELTEANNPQWITAFAMIRNGALYQFSLNPQQTDWSFWLPKGGAK